MSGMCGARSKLTKPDKPDSYLICTNDAGHDSTPGRDPRHTACDGRGHVLARWRSETSPVQMRTPLGGVWA